MTFLRFIRYWIGVAFREVHGFRMAWVWLWGALVFSTAISSCRKDHMTRDELIDYVESPDHGLKKTIQIDEYEYSVVFRPTDLLVAQEGMIDTDTVEINRLRRKYSSQYYFVLKMKKHEKELLHPINQGVIGYGELLQTISFRMKDKVRLVDVERDTVNASDYIFDKTLGSAPSTNVLFAFDKKDIKKTGKFTFQLLEFGLGTGMLSFSFDPKELERTPGIVFPQHEHLN